MGRSTRFSGSYSTAKYKEGTKERKYTLKVRNIIASNCNLTVIKFVSYICHYCSLVSYWRSEVSLKGQPTI